MSGSFDLVLFGLVAALSPVAFAATLVVVRAGRLRAIAFAIGFVIAQFVTCAVLVLLGGWSLPHQDRAHPTVRALLAIGFGLWVLSLARRCRRAPDSGVESPGRGQALLGRLGRLRSPTTFLAGVVLGVGVPRRLVITALAAASIASSGTGEATAFALGALYTILATVIVWLPVLVFILVGDGAIGAIDDTGRWIARRRRTAMFYALLLLGTGSVAVGLARMR
jgi:hypothetical protein